MSTSVKPSDPAIATSEFPESEEPVESGMLEVTAPVEPVPKTDEVESAYGWEVIRQINPELSGERDFSVGEGGETDSALSDAVEGTVLEAFARMIFGLSVVLAIIFMVYYLVRRFGKDIPALSGGQLGQVIGQLHLSRDATLHYVRTGGRVLVVGVNPNGVNLIAEFGASAFDGELEDIDIQGSFNPDGFGEELKSQTDSYAASDSSLPDSHGDDDVSNLRSDIHRLQEYLREETRDSKD